MTQGSEAFPNPGMHRGSFHSPPGDQSNSINNSTPFGVVGMGEKKHNFSNEPEASIERLIPTNSSDEFYPAVQDYLNSKESTTPSKHEMEESLLLVQENLSHSDEADTTTFLPLSISTADDGTSVQEDVTTEHPETDKRAGLKTARSLPEERRWSSTMTPDKRDFRWKTDGNGQGTRQQITEALPYTGQEAVHPQWNDMQKKTGIPLPAFDTNKWLESLRTQYQPDKNPWQTRITDNIARNPRPFHPGSSSDPSQNQLLVVNNRGVVIPNSVQFPEVVKSATYPQLQTYRYPQSSRNVQDILRYMAETNNNVGTNRLRQNQWPPAIKKTAKVASMYVTPTDGYANSFAASRPEAAYLAATSATTPLGGKPLNGHAYFSDPWHSFRPADITEINHLAASTDYNSGYADSDLPSSFVYPTKPAKQAHLRNHFSSTKQPQLQAQSATSYTTAVFKPLGSGDQMATSSGTVDSMMQHVPQQKRVLPPLSVMLEIYPMTHDDPRTVPFRGTATSHSFRRPTQITQINTSPTAGFFQKDTPVRRPVSLAVDASAGSQTVNIPVVAPMQYQTQGQPAFGMTLAGLPPLPGMGTPDSKHRMVVHLNFYPKKNPAPSPVVPRLRDPSEDFQAGVPTSGGTASGNVYAGDFPQRRQSGPPNLNSNDIHSYNNGRNRNYPHGNSVVQAEFDANSLANVLPRDVVQHFSEIFRTYQSSSPHDPDHRNTYEITSDDNGEYEPNMNPGSREDHEGHDLTDDDHDFFDDENSDDEEDDDDDDEEEGRVVPYPEEMRRNPGPSRQEPSIGKEPGNGRVPFYRLWGPRGGPSWTDVQDDEEDEGTVVEMEGRSDDDRPTRINSHGNAKLTAAKHTNTTTTTTERPLAEREDPSLKPRRRLIIDAAPKNHRME